MKRNTSGTFAVTLAISMASAPAAIAKRRSNASDLAAKGNLAEVAVSSTGRAADAIARGDQLYERNELYPAAIEYNRAIESPGNDQLEKQTAAFKMGKTLYKLHYDSAALSYFDQIVRAGSRHPYYNETLQWLAALTREVPDSAGVLEKIGKYDPAELENPRLAPVRDELYFLLGKYHYGKGNLDKAIELFAKVNPSSPFHVQAELFEGATYVREYKAQSAVEAFKQVLRVSQGSSDPKVRDFADLANLSLARVFYSTGQYLLATKYFDRLSRDSYDWPNSLFEAAWANFMLNHGAGYSKALGDIQTLRAPYFDYFIKPESAAEALTLRATIYYYNCLFDRAADTMSEFDDSVPDIKVGLDQLLKSNPDATQFFDTAVKIRRGSSGMRPAVERAARAVLIDKSLSRRFAYVHELDRELAEYDRADVAWKSTAVANNVLSDLNVSRALMVKEAGELARSRIARLDRELAALITRVIKIKYEILEGQKRQEEADLRDEQSSRHVRKAKPLTVVHVDDEHEVWRFDGEYWRDELGYYRYQVANQCGPRGIPEGAPLPGVQPEAGGSGGIEPTPPPAPPPEVPAASGAGGPGQSTAGAP